MSSTPETHPPGAGTADLLAMLPDGVVVADADGRVSGVNPIAAAMLGIGSVEDALGRPLTDVLALTDRDGEGWTQAVDPYGGLRIRTAVPEQSWLLSDGTEALVSARLHRAPRAGCGPGPVTAVAITLRSGRARARLDRDRSDLVATLAHELRSPLTGVKGFVQALLARWDRLTDDQKRLMLTTASADADRLSRLITELLDVARIDTGRLQLHRRPVDLAKKVDWVHQSLSVVTSTPIEVRIADDLPMIDADPDKVLQVVTNLVENAVRHGRGTVLVSVERWADDASYLSVAVSDDGSGIPPAFRERVFTKFWTGGAGGGSGLGLYIVGGLVKAHGGEVRIDDAPSGGARVVTTWPVVDDAPVLGA